MRIRNVILVIFVIAGNFACEIARKPDKTIVRENGNFAVRIKAFIQDPEIGVAGVDNVIEAKTADSLYWSTIMEVSHDDPDILFDDNNIILPSPSIGFVYLVRNYALSLDAGTTWKSAELKAVDPSCLIDSVAITEIGGGEMSLKCNRRLSKLYSSDFGFSWGNSENE
jgi:hypothetical protein